MARLSWDQVGERRFETGVDRGVIYLESGIAVPWNGLISLSENPTGGEPRPFYIDGQKYINEAAPEEYAGSIEAFTYPDEFSECDGTRYLEDGFAIHQQRRKAFGLSYRTRIGNDVSGIDYGYKIHLVYNVLAAPAQKPYSTIGESSEATTFSWDFTTTPVHIAAGYRRVAHLSFDSTKISPNVLEVLEDRLYGTLTEPARLLSPTDIVNLFALNYDFVLIDNEDGTYTIEAENIPSPAADGSFSIAHDDVSDNGDYTFTIFKED